MNTNASAKAIISVLLVDDSAAMREMVWFTLKTAGFDVFQATDGVEALAFAKSNAPVSLVITDINMPNMDGLTLIRELRALQSYRFVPILTLTTEESTEKKQLGKAAGATGWIVKPFDPEILLQTIGRVL
jgi:two-component system chemotaxis response regulator CheY